ncbi:DUF5990 family protein [Streptomyces sp. NBC_01142]|uniref:DUF5990 family protein n=1 Tax=Streptomyces sp. NBC_01142 TaxID=2975865 RepID=UPI0022571E16|nr:DUF5990 family protein [Streptomyces sp. NBC_01142]MCX4822655.1 DUF5990 family protein [Streptomyces sp. NBC_01142]
MARLNLRITGRELPGSACGEYKDIHVGTQRGREPDQLVPADAAEAVFEIPVETVTAPDGTADFRGPYVQGRRGERFIYLTWGEMPPGGEFAMFRRAKFFLADLPEEALAGGSAETGLGLTDGRGMPLCAAVRPPRITWRFSGADG